MHLPELEWQFVYGRLAWAVVLATVMAARLPLAWRSRTTTGALLLAMAALMELPGELSPAYSLVLAFQWPSGLLLGFCLLRLFAARPATPGSASMPTQIAAPIALIGSVLYLDAVGWLSLGLYYWGFDSHGAPLVALGIAAACALAIVRGRARLRAMAMLGAVALFSVLRLPTGNLWDALLDPLLWGWAVISLGVGCCRWLARRTRGPAPAAGSGA